MRREADIALRNFEPTQPDLISKKIKDVNACLYAAKSYLESVGHPTSLSDLENLDYIGFDNTSRLINGLQELGLNLGKRHSPIITGIHVTHWELVKRGLGVGIIAEEIGDNEATVQQVLADFPPFVFPIWLTTHRELRSSKRVKFVFDLLADEIRHS